VEGAEEEDNLDLDADDKELAIGRFIVLHDPKGQDTWDGTFRIVTTTVAGVTNMSFSLTVNRKSIAAPTKIARVAMFVLIASLPQ
jgi:hypothetical protein